MSFYSSRARAAGYFLTALMVSLIGTSTASAQEESLCVVPGLTLLMDATGDVDFQFLPAGLPLDPLDLESLQVAQLPAVDGEERLVFTLKVAALPQLLPRQAWFATFISEDKRGYGVRMVVNNDRAVEFETYAVLIDMDGAISEGRYPATGSVKPAEAESSFDPDGTIRIVVKTANLGLRKLPAALSGFNAGSLQQIPTGDSLTQDGDLLALIADGMPDDMARSGELRLEPDACAASAQKSAATPSSFAGAVGGSALLLLLALAALRRRITHLLQRG